MIQYSGINLVVDIMTPELKTRLNPAAPAYGLADRADVVEIIVPPAIGANRRREERIKCATQGCVVILPTLKILSCQVLDISPGGARIGLDNHVEMCGEIWLVNGGTDVLSRGITAWSKGNSLGIRFNLIQVIQHRDQCPSKVPPAIFEIWRSLRHPGTADSNEVFS